MTVMVLPMDSVQVAESSDYTPIWQAMLEAPKNGRPCFVTGSEKWSVEALQKVRAALRGRNGRSGLPWNLRLMRGDFLAFWWEPRPVFEGAESTPELTAQEKAYREQIEDDIRCGLTGARRYRRSPTYRERIETKKRLRRYREKTEPDPDMAKYPW